jgi:predicted CXXCH cytochrome family protein
MRTRIAVILAVCAALAVAGGTVFAQTKTGMASGAHDLRAVGNTGDYCKTCHVAHGSSTTNFGLIWNHSLSTATYSVWNTIDMPDYKGGPTSVLSSTGSSSLCLSCHDGTVARNVLISNAGAADTTYDAGLLTGNASLTADLKNDHPVGFVYATSVTAKNAQSAGNLATATVVTTTGGLKLFGATADTGTMECGTCHDVHGAWSLTVRDFLRKQNTASALCITCHL